MSITYTPATNFGAKDSLPTNDPDKVIKGVDFTTEFSAIQTAFTLAAPVASPTFTGTVTIPTADINGGTIDGATIATSDITVGASKTLDVSAGTLTLANDQISGDKIEGGTIGSVTITTADINGGAIDGTVIGGATPAAGSFTSLTATSTDATITLTGTRGTGDTHTIATAGANSQNLNISADDSIFLRTSDTIQRVGIFAGGDIAFYEDTGTTPKFFWDASAERLGLGTTSPNGVLETNTTGDNFTYLRSGDANTAGIIFGNQSDSATASIQMLHSDNSLSIRGYNNAERMRIDSSGNVGIGTTSPNAKVEIVNTSAGAVATQLFLHNASDTDGTGARLDFAGLATGTIPTGSISNIRTGAGAYALIFNNYGDGSNSERMRIDSGGAVTMESTGVAKAGMPINTESGTAITLALAENGNYIRCTSASATTVTVPPNSSVAFPVGAEVVIFQAGAGQVTIAAGAGVTLNSKDSNLKIGGQYGAATCKKVATDTWDVIGDLSA